MSKPLLLSLVTTLLSISLSSHADDITIDFSTMGYSNAEAVSVVELDDVTLTFSKGSNTNGNKPTYYDTGTAVRLYGGNTMTISCPRYISSVTLSFDKGNAASDSNFDVDCGEATTGNPTTWTGPSTMVNTVTFSNTAPSGHWRIQTISINFISLPEIAGIAALREQADGSLVRLVFNQDNPGNIEWVDQGDATYAYVRDNDMAVRFTNFLPDDPGWHTTRGGALIGAVEGRYQFVSGMPEFTHISTSIADSILCLDSWQPSEPVAISDLELLKGINYRADYVAMEGVSLTTDSEGNYMIVDGNVQLPISNPFGLSDIIPSDLDGREFSIQGILGVSDDGSSSELYYTQIDEIIPELSLGEALYTNAGIIGTYDHRQVNVKVERRFATNMWNTLCLPFDIYEFSDIVSSAKLAEFTGYDASSNTLEFSSVESLKAGLPYLVYPLEEVTTIRIMGTTIVNETTPVTNGIYDMVGIFEPTTLYEGDSQVLFLGDNNTLYHPSVTNDLKAFRAYFRTTSEQTAHSAKICVDGIVSDIHSATLDMTSDNPPIYSVSGQMMGSSTRHLPKGVYVTSGNKVIIK